jgi:predicted DNA-binding WGR domain protein
MEDSMTIASVELRQKQGRAGERYWRCAVHGDTVSTEWGAVTKSGNSPHGATSDIPGPKGKAGKSYFTAEQNAKFTYERLIRKKKEEGYIELGIVSEASSEINFTIPLPKNLCFSKPKNSIEPDQLEDIVRTGAIFTRKVNGMGTIIYLDVEGDVTIYSRRMDDVTEKFPHAVPRSKT